MIVLKKLSLLLIEGCHTLFELFLCVTFCDGLVTLPLETFFEPLRIYFEPFDKMVLLSIIEIVLYITLLLGHTHINVFSSARYQVKSPNESSNRMIEVIIDPVPSTLYFVHPGISEFSSYHSPTIICLTSFTLRANDINEQDTANRIKRYFFMMADFLYKNTIFL